MHSPDLRTRALLLPLLATACLGSLPAPPATAPRPVMDPVVFFTGHTHGEGTLERRVGSDRALSVEGQGHMNPDGSFQLDQTVSYADSSVEHRTWLLRRTDPTHYSASLSDAKGEVTGETTGNLFHLRYQIGSPRVFMEQWLYLQPDGRSVMNHAEVTVLGVPYAHLAETITRVP